MDKGLEDKVVPEDSMSAILFGLGQYKEATEPISPRAGHYKKDQRYLPMEFKDRQRAQSHDIQSYYKNDVVYRHQLEDNQSPEDMNGRGKRGFKEILRDEIRNARDPKVYGRA